MANEQNLQRLTTSKAREIGKKGGKASGAAKRERKALKDELLALLSDGDTQAKMCIALIKQAQRGNIKAFEVVRDTIGEKPIAQIEGLNESLINESIVDIANLIRSPRPNRGLPDNE